jgi:hypothetical protein
MARGFAGPRAAGKDDGAGECPDEFWAQLGASHRWFSAFWARRLDFARLSCLESRGIEAAGHVVWVFKQLRSRSSFRNSMKEWLHGSATDVSSNSSAALPNLALSL